LLLLLEGAVVLVMRRIKAAVAANANSSRRQEGLLLLLLLLLPASHLQLLLLLLLLLHRDQRRMISWLVIRRPAPTCNTSWLSSSSSSRDSWCTRCGLCCCSSLTITHRSQCLSCQSCFTKPPLGLCQQQQGWQQCRHTWLHLAPALLAAAVLRLCAAAVLMAMLLPV
jgi:hypothetical protein